MREQVVVGLANHTVLIRRDVKPVDPEELAQLLIEVESTGPDRSGPPA